MIKQYKGRSIHQQGLALVSILIITFILAALFSSQISQTNLGIKEVKVLANKAQAWEYALSGEAYAMEILYEDLANTTVDHLNESWHLNNREYLPPGAQMYLSIEDLQGRFNLNNLVNTNGSKNIGKITEFKRLLSRVNIDETLADFTADWLDKDNLPTTLNTEDAFFYEKFGFYSADSPLMDTKELGTLIHHYGSPQSIEVLLQSICALPEKTPINVNTANELVLSAISTSIDYSAIIANRKRKPNGYLSAEEFVADNIANTAGGGFAAIGVRSNYFLATTTVIIDGLQLALESYIHRTKQPKEHVTVLYRKQVIPKNSTHAY